MSHRRHEENQEVAWSPAIIMVGDTFCLKLFWAWFYWMNGRLVAGPFIHFIHSGFCGLVSSTTGAGTWMISRSIKPARFCGDTEAGCSLNLKGCWPQTYMPNKVKLCWTVLFCFCTCVPGSGLLFLGLCRK